jgi:hypothetical protein
MKMVKSFPLIALILGLFNCNSSVDSFSLSVRCPVSSRTAFHLPTQTSSESLFRLRNSLEEPGVSQDVVELVPMEEKLKESVSKPQFISQSNEIAEDVLKPNFSDPKQVRVILYLILALAPVIMLIPLMIGSRDFIPPEALPPVTM